jgi:thioredoxin
MLKLNGSDLAPILKNKTPVLAVFYAEWCPFCISFLPEFEQLKSENFEVAEVDISDEENPLWEEYRIDVVPTLIAFENGKETTRRNGRRGIGLSRRDIDDLRRELEKTSA